MRAQLHTRLALAGLLLALAAPLPAAGAGDDLAGAETALAPGGGAYEINPGPDGTLWVSDNQAGELRAYAPDGTSLRTYTALGAVSDARAGAGGRVWYVDQDTRRLGQLETISNTVRLWPLPASGASGTGTALDAQDRVWVSNFAQALLFRFDPALAEMCTLDTSALASSGSPYLAFDGAALWLADLYHNAVLRLNPATSQLTRWSLAAGWDLEAESLAPDGFGGLWFTDGNTGALGRLDLASPAAPRLLRYPLPAGSGRPNMLTRQAGRVWYSSASPAGLGALNPDAASPGAFVPAVSQAALAPACATLPAPAAQPVTVTTGAPAWTPAAYPLAEPAPGWQVVSLPADGYPWGATYQRGRLWAVDNGRGVLVRAPVGVSATACAEIDADGDLATPADHTPLPGQSIYLRAGGARQEPPQATGADGCVTWAGLAAGQVYGLEVVPAAGQQWLTPLLVQFEAAPANTAFDGQFVRSARGGGNVYLPMLRR